MGSLSYDGNTNGVGRLRFTLDKSGDVSTHNTASVGEAVETYVLKSKPEGCFTEAFRENGKRRILIGCQLRDGVVHQSCIGFPAPDTEHHVMKYINIVDIHSNILI